MPTYLNAHAKLNKWIYDIQYPGNRFESDIILNDFWSSTIWASHFRLLLNEVETPKNPGIQPNYAWYEFNKLTFLTRFMPLPGNTAKQWSNKDSLNNDRKSQAEKNDNKSIQTNQDLSTALKPHDYPTWKDLG